MKKLLSFFMAVGMLACLFAPAASAENTVYTDSMHHAYETEADIAALASTQCTSAFSTDGVFGSQGAVKITATGSNAGLLYYMNLAIGKLYNVSVYIKPLDYEAGASVQLYLITAAQDGGSGWEQISLQKGETTADGYVRYYIDNYRVSDRVYPGSQQEPLAKDPGASSTFTIRANTSGGTYLLDELKVTLSDYVAYEDFDTKVANIPAVYTQPTTSTAGTSETYTADIIAHNQSVYTEGTDGYAYIAGSSTRGAYFTNVTLMPATTYRLSADVTASSSYTAQVGAYLQLQTSDNANLVSSGTMYGPATEVAAGESQHIEYYFRTANVSTTDYAESGVTFDRIGIASPSNVSYIIWQLDNMKLEKVDEIVPGGSMDGLTTFESSSKTYAYSNAYCGATQVADVSPGGNDTQVIPVADDGTNENRGDYLKLAFTGTASAGASNTNTNRRGVWYMNLKKGTQHRISFWAKLVSDDETATASMAGMYNVGKVDANGLVNGEEGYNSTSASYGYIDDIHNTVQLTTQWQKVSAVFTTQNRQQIGQLYLGVSGFEPQDDIVMAIDELVVEPIGETYYDAGISYANKTVSVTEQAGEQVGEVSDKAYTFYVSNDGTSFAKAKTSAENTFVPGVPYSGKYVKAVVTGTKADGSVISDETEAIFIPGFVLKFTSDFTQANITATATYYPEADETASFEGIIALYDAAGELLAVDSFASANNAAAMTIPADSEAAKAKIFAWSSLNSAIPLARRAEITR